MRHPATSVPESVLAPRLAPLAAVLSLLGCGAQATVAPAAVRPAGQTSSVSRLLYPVITTPDGVFISLGPGTWVEGARTQRIEFPGDGFYTQVAPASGPLPVIPSRFTVLSTHGPCDLAAGDPVILDRRGHEPEFEEYYGRETALAVSVSSQACDEADFAYAAGAGTRLQVFHFADGELGEPSLGTTEDPSLACVVTFPPSEDGICAGFPPTVHITAGDTPIFHAEVERWVDRVALLDSGGRRYVVIEWLEGFDVMSLSGDVVESARNIGAVDMAETCL